ncbi:LIM domain-containing protein [Sporodiniella umbellata]|nr:LIM domain-containing protein [Sporodiniella umbellata]
MATENICFKCQKDLGDSYIKALDHTFHQDCFVCSDCKVPLTSQFVSHPTEPGHVLCQNDYNKRMDLFCAKCHEPLEGTYTIAFGKKYHPDHFTCSDCSTPLGKEFFEHDQKPYCPTHYSARFTGSCTGCTKAILKQYIEVKHDQETSRWHPECYKEQTAH